MDSTNAKKHYWPQAAAPEWGQVKLEEIQAKCGPFLEQAAKHHTEPMNLFLQQQLPAFLEGLSKKGIRVLLNGNEAHVFRWQRPRLVPPSVSPHECRERNQSYTAAIVVDIYREILQQDKSVENKLLQKDYCLFSIPLMLGTRLDSVRIGEPGAWLREYEYDSGGFYISQSGSMGMASERIMPLNLYRRHNHPFLSPVRVAGGGGDKKTASKSFAAASTQYQKVHQEHDDDPDDDDEDQQPQKQAGNQQQQQDLCMELRCLHESRNLFYSTCTMKLVLTGYYVKKTEKKSHQLYVLLPEFKPKNEPVMDSKDGKKKKKKNARIPLLTILVALGYTPAKTMDHLQALNNAWGHPDLRSMLDCDRILHFVFQRHNRELTPSKALAQIGKSTKDDPGSDDEEKYVKLGHSTLSMQMLPFIGLDASSYGAKARYLIYLFWLAMMRMAGIDTCSDDQDHEVNQRYETNAAAWASLIRQGLALYLSNAETSLRNYYNTDPDKRGAIDWSKVFKERIFSKRLAWCLSTGIWSPKQITKDTRRNMSMSLSRTNDGTYSSYIRRAATTVKAQDKSIKPRMLQMSHYGRADAGDTSEGDKSGSVRMMTDGFCVSTGSSSAVLWALLGDQLLPEDTFPPPPGSALVLLNGCPKGWTRDAAHFCEHVRSKRRLGLIHGEVSVSWHKQHQSVVYLLTEPGRSLRPLVSLHRPFAVELIDASEERNLLIAFSGDEKGQATHLELDSALLFGGTMNTPFAETDQSPRITFQMNMNRQALPGYGLHNPLRCQPGAQIGLFYAHRPFAAGGGSSHGLNLLEAIGTDVTDEDNMVFSRNLLESGGFLGFQTRTYHAKETGPVSDKIRFPHIDPQTGLPEIGTMLEEDQPILTRKDESIDVRTNDQGQVTRTSRNSKDGSGRAWLTFILQVLRGDKFSSRHGQKVTKSISRRAAHMLFDPNTGEIVDVITTLICLAGRMTAGQLHEMQAGIRGTREATFFSGKAFSTPVEFYRQNMQDSAADYRQYVNGRTGRPLNCRLYTGIVFQMRLKHLVLWKEHARGIGPVISSTRQPTENRSKKSGLRLGEMERDCMVGYGASYNADERYCAGSDLFHVDMCKRCGIRTNKSDVCNLCLQSSTIKRIQMSAATKTFCQELEACGILPRFEIDHSPLFVRKLDQLLCPPSSAPEELDEAVIDRLVSLCIQEADQQQPEAQQKQPAKAARKRKKRVASNSNKDIAA